MKYFGKFTSKKAFLRANLRPSTLRRYMAASRSDWVAQSLILRHRNTPVDIVDRYARHNLWYVRIVAMLSQSRWRRYIDRALADKKSTVRFCAYRRAEFESYMPLATLTSAVISDKNLRGYRFMLLRQWHGDDKARQLMQEAA